MRLQEICNVIILISAVIIACKNIYAFVKKPVKDISDKINQKEEAHIEAIIQKEVPILLKKHDEDNKVERKQEEEQQVNSIIEAIDEKMVKIKKIDIEEMENIKKTILDLRNAQISVLRYGMIDIYEHFSNENKIPQIDKEAFEYMYECYRQMGGNGYIDKIYKELSSWEVIK